VNQILVVEDEPDMAVTYERALRRAGHRVVTAVSCAEGIRLLESVRPRLVISDLRLPDGDGLEIIWAARKLDPAPPVIAVTAFDQDHAHAQSLAAGFVDHLAKPVEPEALCRAVARANTR